MHQTRTRSEEKKQVRFDIPSLTSESESGIQSPTESEYSDVGDQEFVAPSKSQIQSTTKAEVTPPPARIRTDEEYRLRALTPNPHLYPLILGDLQSGLGLSKTAFSSFLGVFYDHIEETGVLAFEYPEGPVAQAVLAEVVTKLLVYLKTAKPAGFPATPEWFMSEWAMKLLYRWRGEESRKREAIDKEYRELRSVVTGRLSPAMRFSSGPFEENTGLALPRPAARRHSHMHPPLRQDHLVFPADSFTGRVESATIDQCIVSVDVWRLGTREEQAPLEVAASRFLRPGAEPRIHGNYALDVFVEVYEDKINADKSKQPVEIRFGRLGYFTTDGNYIKVVDQDSFEVALNRLFLARGRDNVFKFIFQPESEDKRIERKAREEDEKAARLVEEQDDARIDNLVIEIEAGIAAQNEGKGKGPAPRSPPLLTPLQHRSDWPLDFRSTISGIETPEPSPDARTSMGEGIYSPGTNATSVNTPAKDFQSQAKADEEEFFGERSPSAQSIRSRSSSVRITLKKALRSRGKETDIERDERWEKLFQVEKRLAFTRGGSEEEVDLEIYETDEDVVVDGEGEVPEIDEVFDEEEEEEESETKEADRVVAKLQDLQNLPELGQLRDPNFPIEDIRWKECCRMFSIDPVKTALSELVLIAGLKTKIYQYQAFGVYWQMLTSRKLGGGFVADSMGLGKTLSFLSFFVVERQLSCLWADVDKSRKAKDGKHLQLDEQHEDDVCPEKSNLGWISCPCASSSPTSGLAPKFGVRLACVPDALVRSWWKEWKTHVDTAETTLALNIVVDYKGAFDLRTPQADSLANSSNFRNKTRLESIKSGGQKADKPHERQSGWLVLTTAKSFKDWIKKFEYKGHVLGKDGKWKTGTRYQIVFGIAMIDESHEEYFKQTGRGKVLADLPPGNEPYLWGYSGTPFSQTPRGLEGVLWAIEHHAPEGRHQMLQNFEYKKLDKICKDFDIEIKKERPSETNIDRILEDFKPFLLNFVIRRTAETLWFGHRLIKLKQHCHQDMILSTALRRRAELQSETIATFENNFQHEKEKTLAQIQERWDNFPEKRRTEIRPMKLGFNTLCHLQWRLRILATFPFLVKLANSLDDNSRLDLTPEEALGFVRPGEKIKDNPYFRHIRNIVEDSPKCLWLSFLIQMIEKQTDYKGDEQKLIIMTAFPQVAFILKMFLLKYFPKMNDRVGLILPRMKVKDKTEALEAFTDAHDENGKRKQRRNNQILIGTTRLIGTGLQLTRACNLVLMEPDYEFIKELQAYGRVHRIGQKNKYSFSYRLIDSASEIERRILKRQQDRKEVAGRALKDDELRVIEDSTIPELHDEEATSQPSSVKTQ